MLSCILNLGLPFGGVREAQSLQGVQSLSLGRAETGVRSRDVVLAPQLGLMSMRTASIDCQKGPLYTRIFNPERTSGRKAPRSLCVGEEGESET